LKKVKIQLPVHFVHTTPPVSMAMHLSPAGAQTRRTDSVVDTLRAVMQIHGALRYFEQPCIKMSLEIRLNTSIKKLAESFCSCRSQQRAEDTTSLTALLASITSA
jgi:hypothetical protein